MDNASVLQSVNFGHRVAEDERDELVAYFVETEQWRKVWNDEVDVVFAPKGGGKSAIYSMLVSRESELFDKNVLIAVGENPKGNTAFKELEDDPPTSEAEFVGIWKLYFLSLTAAVLVDYGFKGKSVSALLEALAEIGLVEPKIARRTLVKRVMTYVRAAMRPPKAVEASMHLDAASGAPTGVTGRIVFGEPTAAESTAGMVSVDSLYELAHEALDSHGFRVWLLLDRLDVAFAESHELEENALRGLFRAYLDLKGLSTIGVKIFLRSDIWRSITTSGFREASHITKELSISWNEASLLQLVIRRLLKSKVVCDAYGVDPAAVVADAAQQRDLFGRVFPAQVELGSRKSTTFDWCLARTKDGLGVNAPRELIHLMTSARDSQVARFERGEAQPSGENLFERQALKDAMPNVSEVRLTKTIYAEYPNMKPWLEALEGQKTHHSSSSLAAIWQVTEDEAEATASRLVEIGFFERRGDRGAPTTYWVPFLYRPALKLVQGAAEGVAQDADGTEVD